MAKARVVVTATDNIAKGLNQSKKSLNGFAKYIQELDDKITKAFNFAAISAASVVAFKTMTNAAKQMVNEYTEAEKVTRRMTAVWENVGRSTGIAATKFADYADQVEKTTYFTGEAVQEAGILLAATESLTDDGFKRALDASIDLAAALGEDVTSAASTLSKAIQEPESALSRLKSIGVSFTEDEKELINTLIDSNKQYEAQALILDKIEQKYKGVAKAVADTPSGKLDQIKDTLGDIRETLGQGIIGALDPAFTFILDMLQRIHKWAKDHVDEKNFWNELSTGTSHQIYNNYSEEFLQERQTDAMQDVADQLELIRKTDWGELLANADWSRILGGDVQLTLEELLSKDKSTIYYAALAAAKDAYGENFSSYIGDVEGLLEIITDQYEPLIKNLNTINGALKEYEDFRILGHEGGGASGESSGTVTKSDMELLLEDYGKYSASMQERLLGAEFDRILNMYVDASEYDKVYLSEILDSLGDQILNLRPQASTEGGTNVSASTGGTYEPRVFNGSLAALGPKFITDMGEGIGEAMKDLGFVSVGGQADNFGASVISSFVESMGTAGEVAASLASNMSQMGPAMGALATGLQYVFQGISEVIGPQLESIMQSLLTPLTEIGKIIGSVIAPVLDILAPILSAFADTFKYVSGTFQYITQTLRHWVATVMNWLAGLNIFGWYPFSGLRMSDPGSPGSFSSFIDNYVNGLSSDAGSSASTATALSSASYRGATSVTINIYPAGPIVGDGGMREFARMIRDEFDALDYYGVTA